MSAIAAKLRFDILKRDNFTCKYCGRSAPGVTLHIDHVQPKANGGNNHPDNLVTACDTCNFGKGARELKVIPVNANGGRGLEGLFFHTFTDDGGFAWQGVVESHPSDDRITVQLFSWLDGSEGDRIVVPIMRLASAQFYDRNIDMKRTYWRRGYARGDLRTPPEEAEELDMKMHQPLRSHQ